MLTFNFEISSFFIIDSDHVIITYQIYEYTHEHGNSLEFMTIVKKLIRFLVLINSKNNKKTFERLITRSQSIKFTLYFEN